MAKSRILVRVIMTAVDMEIRERALEIKILTARVTSRNTVTKDGDLIKARQAMATGKLKRSREIMTME